MKIRRFNEEITVPGLGIEMNPSVGASDGWINIKVDNKLKLRISKYINKYNFKDTEDIIDRFNRILENRSADRYNDKINYLILVQYLKEIRDNFDATASGFLMEDLTASILNGKVKTGNKMEDVMVGKVSYQIKFYDMLSPLKIDENRLCDNTIICVKNKQENNIYIFLIKKETLSRFSRGMTKGADGKYRKNNKININLKELVARKGKETDKIKSVVIDFDEIQETFDSIKKEIKDSIVDMYDSLALLHDGIDEFLISGESSSVDVIDKISTNIVDNIRSINDSSK